MSNPTSVTESLTAAKPVIKWVGGKTRLLPEITQRMPETYGRYYEPFVGGGALFLRLAPERAVINDFNADLVNLYRVLGGHEADVELLIRSLEAHRENHSKSYYYAIRGMWNEPESVPWTSIDRAAALVYLNKTCFNGLWRVNAKGHFNVPMGKYENPTICDPNAIRAAARVFRRAEIRCGDYCAAVADAQAGDFVYFDPPYDVLNPTSFTKYTNDAFGKDQQRELAEVFHALVGSGVKVMLSNADTPYVRELYANYRIDQVFCGRSINSSGDARGPVPEVLVMGGY